MTLSPACTTEDLLYRVCGLTLASDVPFPELAAVSAVGREASPDVYIRLSAPHEGHPLPPPLTWMPSETEPWRGVAKSDEGYVLRFHDLADFFLQADGRRIGCADPRVAPDGLRHLVLDHVLPLALTLHGKQALHATAVLTANGVAAFVGPSGVGKSTVAASCLFAGWPVISDDCLVLEPQNGRILARPAYPGLRLLEDTLEALGADRGGTQPMAEYSTKRRVMGAAPAGPFPTDPLPLVRIYVLSRREGTGGAEPLIQPLTRTSAFIEVLGGAFTLEAKEPVFLQRQFDWVGQVVEQVPVRRLRLPEGLASLATVRAAILSDLGAT